MEYLQQIEADKKKHQQAVEHAETMRKRAIAELMRTVHGRAFLRVLSRGIDSATLCQWVLEFNEDNNHLL